MNNSNNSIIQYPRNNLNHNHILSDRSSYVYKVHFKRASRYFILAPGVKHSYNRGDFVKVEADRGEDMGIIISKIPSSDYKENIPTAGYRGKY
jgi:hypothetical protein